MRNRKRRCARPMLESMEPRVVPSVVGIVSHHHPEKVAPAHVGQVSTSVREANASERKNNEALRSLEQQEHLVEVHAREKSPQPCQRKRNSRPRKYQALSKI